MHNDDDDDVRLEDIQDDTDYLEEVFLECASKPFGVRTRTTLGVYKFGSHVVLDEEKPLPEELNFDHD